MKRCINFFKIILIFMSFNLMADVDLHLKVGHYALKGDNRAAVFIDYPSTRKTATVGPHEKIRIKPQLNDFKELEHPKKLAVLFNSDDSQFYGAVFDVKKDCLYQAGLKEHHPMICLKNIAKPASDRNLICVKETCEELSDEGKKQSTSDDEIINIDIKRNGDSNNSNPQKS